jgi:hypothetical protein
MEEYKIEDYILKTSYNNNTNILSFDLSNERTIVSYHTKIDLNNFNNSNNVKDNYYMIFKYLNKSSKTKNQDSFLEEPINQVIPYISRSVDSAFVPPIFSSIERHKLQFSTPRPNSSISVNTGVFSLPSNTLIINCDDEPLLKKNKSNDYAFIKITPYIGYIELSFSSRFNNENFKIFLKEKIDISLIEEKFNNQIIKLKKIIERQKDLFNSLYKIPEVSNIIDKNNIIFLEFNENNIMQNTNEKL